MAMAFGSADSGANRVSCVGSVQLGIGARPANSAE